MKDAIKHLENSIQEYTNYWGTDNDIRTMFDFVSEFFESNLKGNMKDKKKNQVSKEWMSEHKN